MARKLRSEYPGAIYHVMNRGDRCEPIFWGDADREMFLETLGEACVETGWGLHAYGLMSSHFHLVLETPRGNLVSGMKWLLRDETMTLAWVAKRLRMGTKTHLSHLLYWQKRGQRK